MKSQTPETKIKLLTIRQAAKLIDGLTEYRIRQLCLSGELPHFKSGQKHLINEQVLLDFITQPQISKQEDNSNE